MQIGCKLLAIFVVLSRRFTPCAGEPAIQIARLLGFESAVAMLADGGRWRLDNVGRYIQEVMAVVSLACIAVLESPNTQGVPPWAAHFFPT